VCGTFRRVLTLVLLAGVIACAPHREPDAANDEVLHYDFVPLAERSARIDWQADLIIDERGDNLDYALGQAVPRVARGPEGRFYVLDPSGYRVQVFERDGEFAFSFGTRGQGPCELDFGGSVLRLRPSFAFAGNRLIIGSSGRGWSVWNRQGSCLAELPTPIGLWRGFSRAPRLVGLGDDLVVALYDFYDPEAEVGDQAVALLRVRDDAVEEARRFARRGPAAARLDFAAQAPDAVYVAHRDITRTTQQMIAFDLQGAVRWMIDMPWPATLQGYGKLRVDGHGHVYLFFGNLVETSDGALLHLVDVFDSNGERIAAATMPGIGIERVWQDVAGDDLYGVDQHPETAEWRVIRSRLIEPFD
jgi:hypothetical protein